MSKLTITGYVTRDELALPDLDLNTDDYKIMGEGWGPGSITWDRNKISSPFVDGDYLASAKKEEVEVPLHIRVMGTDYADTMDKVQTLREAFEQFSYLLSVTVEGVEFQYRCQPADSAFGDGGVFQPYHFRAYKQEIKFSIPRFPNPEVGPY